jgi:DNA invertase Pin-like site-specific DNA recombinase
MAGKAAAAKRVGLYLRVSTAGRDQTVENQRQALTAAMERKGWQIVAEFCDEGISGAKGREKRPGFDRLYKAIARREIDAVAAWSVDRLGRSLQDLVAFLREIHAAGVDLYLDRQGLDTSTPAGKAMFQTLGMFAEFERAIIQERIHAGIARARTAGTKSGKPIGRPGISADKEQAIRAALASGKGVLKVAREVGTGSSTVQRIKAEMTAEAANAV